MEVPAFIKKRQSALLYTAGTVTSVYFASKWAMRKFTQALTSQSRSARDQQQLKKRFQMAVQDTEFTIAGLVPVLEDSIWRADDLFDVEGFSRRLKALNEHLKREKERTLADSTAALIASSPSSSSSAAAGNEPMSMSKALGSLNPNAPTFVPGQPSPPLPSASSETDSVSAQTDAASTQTNEASTQINAASETPSYAQVAAAPPAIPAQDGQSADTEPAAPASAAATKETMSRAELWHEIKILTLTRFVTFLHTMSLVALLSTIQLALLSRKSYVDSFAAANDSQAANGTVNQKQRDPSPFDTSFPPEGKFEDEDLEKFLFEQKKSDVVTAETERAYLTMSWFVMNVRWRQVADDVRARVEDHFASTSLKTLFSADSLFTMIMQCLPPPSPRDALPSTAEEERQTLEAGGLSSSLVTPPLRHLLDETDDLLSSHDCQTVLRSLQECMLRKMLSLASSAAPPTMASIQSGEGEEGFALARWLPVISARSQIERSRALECLKSGLFRDWAVLVYASWSDDQFD